MVTLDVNGQKYAVHSSLDSPLLWALREDLALRGTKYGCGIGVCGICTVHVDGQARHACVTTSADVVGKQIITIEGLAQHPNRIISAWIAEQASQCGYCQPGQIMTAAALLAQCPSPSDVEIDAAMSKVLCRCGTYQRIRQAIRRAVLDKSKVTPQATGRTPKVRAEEAAFNPWLRIAADGTVTLVIDRSEMGQGVTTGLAMLAAEELEIDLAELRTEFAPAHPDYFNAMLGAQVTGGSTSVRAAWKPLRKAAAGTRERLVAAAAATWNVPRTECRAEHGAVMHLPSRRRLGYGDLAHGAAAQKAPNNVRLKRPGAFRLIGTPQQRLDLPDQVCGRAMFGSDVSVPGMLTAVVARSPVLGGRVKAVNGDRTRTVEGVREIVELETGVAVVSEGVWSALRGREALEITWDHGLLAALGSAEVSRRFMRASARKGWIGRDDGDVDNALAEATTVIDAIYETPYLAHATMEPMNCTAHVGADSCDVWVPTQAQTEAQRVAAKAADLPLEKVRIHTTLLGGGFGRRLDPDFVDEAVRIAKVVGRPVQVVWTRDDDMRHDHYRPANYTRISGRFRQTRRAARVVSTDRWSTARPRRRRSSLRDPKHSRGACDSGSRLRLAHGDLSAPHKMPSSSRASLMSSPMRPHPTRSRSARNCCARLRDTGQSLNSQPKKPAGGRQYPRASIAASPFIIRLGAMSPRSLRSRSAMLVQSTCIASSARSTAASV